MIIHKTIGGIIENTDGFSLLSNRYIYRMFVHGIPNTLNVGINSEVQYWHFNKMNVVLNV